MIGCATDCLAGRSARGPSRHPTCWWRRSPCSRCPRPPAYLVGDGPMRQALVRLVQARELQTVVRLPGWSYQPSRYVSRAAVHVVPSREESWSQSAVMALGLGVPVVGTVVDGLAGTLGNGRGVLVPPDNPHALAAALSRVLAGQRPSPAQADPMHVSLPAAPRPRYTPTPTATCSPVAPSSATRRQRPPCACRESRPWL